MYAHDGFDGISFPLGDGFVGIDIDNYRLQVETTAYRETSPTGAGIKIIGRAMRIGGEIKFQSDGTRTRTTWTSGRFFAITGQDSAGDHSAIARRGSVFFDS